MRPTGAPLERMPMHRPPDRMPPQAPTPRPRSPNPRRRARLGLTAALAVLALALGAAPAVGAKPSAPPEPCPRPLPIVDVPDDVIAIPGDLAAWQAYRLGKVETKVGSRWVVADRKHRIVGRAGRTTHLRVHLLPDCGQDAKVVVPLRIRVPGGTAGRRGTLEIAGDLGIVVGAPESREPRAPDQPPSAKDAPVVKDAPPVKDASCGGEVLAALMLAPRDGVKGPVATARARTPQSVTGYATIPFAIRWRAGGASPRSAAHRARTPHRGHGQGAPTG